jgi:FkbM family methyltransferase
MFLSKLKSLLTALEFRGAIRAMVTWPKFSLASFLIISRLKRAGILPGTVIDLGANVGQFAVAAAHLFDGAQICSIEPDPRTADRLRKNLRDVKQAEIFAVAVGDSPGTAEFFVNRDSQVSSMLSLGRDRINSFPQSTVVEKITIPVTTLDILFQDKPLAGPILVKIDVQGFEDRVIRGGKGFLAKVDWVLIEVSFANLYEGERDFNEISGLMAAQGFRFLRPMNFHTSPLTGEIIEMDALFQRNPSLAHNA